MRPILARALGALIAISLIVTPAFAAADQAGRLALTQSQKAQASVAQSVASGFNQTSMARWNLAKARVRANAADAVIAFVGDSTTAGHGAGDSPTGNFNNARFRTIPARVAQQLAALGLPASAEPVFGGNTIDGNNATITKLQTYNPQVAVSSSGTSDWFFATIYTLGGWMLSNTAGTGAWSLTPALPFDTVDVYYLNATSNGTMTVDVGGTALGTITNSGATSVAKASFTTAGAPTPATINIRRVAGANPVRLLGVVPRNSTLRRVQVVNGGWEGAQTGDWAGDDASATYHPASTSVGSPTSTLVALNPDLTVIKLGANDMGHSSVAQSRANLGTVIAAAKAGGGSCVLVVPTPQNPATRDPSGLTASYNQMVRDLAVAKGCGLVDLYSRYGSYAAMSAAGYLADDVHSLSIGYANEGDIIARALFES